MARKSNTRAAQGSGTIRQRPDGRWEARYTAGRDPGTGKQIQRSIYGATQKEVRQKLAQAVAALDSGTYTAPSKMTVGQWLDIWQRDYLGGVKLLAVQAYNKNIRIHINPAIGALHLETLAAHTVQKFVNDLGKQGLSPKTIRNVHGVLHKALKQAVLLGYMKANPADYCTLPRMDRKEITPLDSAGIAAFMQAIQGHRFESVYLVSLFTGMRKGEVCGLTWDCVDLGRGTIRIDKQLQNIPGKPGEFHLVSSKNGKGRTITAAPSVVELLRRQKAKQAEMRLKAGPVWEAGDFVFTDEVGRHIAPSTLYHNFKQIVATIGLPSVRLHDLRHSYAVAALRAGDDIKTVQGNLGHYTAAFTLDVYGHVTEEMKQASAERMEQFIQGVSNL